MPINTLCNKLAIDYHSSPTGEFDNCFRLDSQASIYFQCNRTYDYICQISSPGVVHIQTASDADAIEVSLKMVEESDVYLGIYAHRYGYRWRGNRGSCWMACVQAHCQLTAA